MALSETGSVFRLNAGGICLSLLSPEGGDSTKILYKNQADRKDLPDSFGISEEIQFAHGTFFTERVFRGPAYRWNWREWIFRYFSSCFSLNG